MTNPASPLGTWSNWTGSRAASLVRERVPSTEVEVVALVARARDENLRVRAVGTGYSWADAVDDDSVLVRSTALRGVGDVDRATGTVRIAAGTTLQDACRHLWQAGFELPTLGGFSGQTIAGAVSTATHGSGVWQQALSAYAHRLRIVDGHGRVVVVDESTPDELRAARVSLGLLGVVTEVEMRVHAASWLRTVDTWHDDIDPAWFTTDDGVRRAVRWHSPGTGSPDDRAVHLREWIPVRAHDEGAVPSFTALASAGDARPAPFFVTEHSLASDDAMAALATLQRALQANSQRPLTMPLSVRTVAPDDAHLSPYRGGARVTVSAAAADETSARALFRVVHDALISFGTVPHWAKEHLYSRSMLRQRLSGLQNFEKVRDEFDPRGMFLTKDMRALLTDTVAEQTGGEE